MMREHVDVLPLCVVNQWKSSNRRRKAAYLLTNYTCVLFTDILLTPIYSIIVRSPWPLTLLHYYHIFLAHTNLYIG